MQQATSKRKDRISGPVSGLLDEEGVREAIWPDPKSRPSRRWFLGLKEKGLLPYHRIGRLIFFDPEEVRRALDNQFKVSPRRF